MKHYLDITVEITPAAGGDYTVEISSSQMDGARSTLRLPAIAPLSSLAWSAETRAALGPAGAPAPPVSATAIGATLFDALFHGPAMAALSAEAAVAGQRDETGVRIRLTMNLQDAGIADVASLPWELLWRPGDQAPLLVSTRTTLVRKIVCGQRRDLKPFTPPLRILVVMSNPAGSAPLNLEDERQRLQDKWAGMAGNVAVTLVPPVRRRLLDTLAEFPYHVLHFMGHGDFRVDGGGILLLEQEDGTPDPIEAHDFAAMLADEPLRLVFLNACKTGVTGDERTPTPFGGVAAALIASGVPAVVAMQAPISDRAAVDVATVFYQRITQGLPVDGAMAEARKALYVNGETEWATPVLYLQSNDGALFFSYSEPVGEAAPAPRAADDPWASESGTGARVFLAAPCERLKPLQRSLAKDLRAEGLRVVDALPPPYDAAGHEAAMTRVLQDADLCVHLLGDTPGELIDEADPLRSFPLEQLRLARDAGRARVVVVPDVDPDTIEDSRYRDVVRALPTESYPAGQFEFVRTSRLEVKAAIMANLRRREQARQATASAAGGASVQAAFVDSHDVDQDCANALVTFLSDRNVDAFLQTSDSAASAELMPFADTLTKYPLYIIVAGQADREWVRNRTNAARTSAVKARAAILIGRYEGPTGPVTLSQLKIVAALKRPSPEPIETIFAREGDAR